MLDGREFQSSAVRGKNDEKEIKLMGLDSLVERVAGRRQSDTGMAKCPPMALCSTHTLAILRLVLSMSQFRELDETGGTSSETER